MLEPPMSIKSSNSASVDARVSESIIWARWTTVLHLRWLSEALNAEEMVGLMVLEPRETILILGGDGLRRVLRRKLLRDFSGRTTVHVLQAVQINF